MYAIVSKNWRFWFIAVIPWTAANAMLFVLLALLYEPYSLSYYLNGYGSLSDFNFEELPRYIGFFIVILVMSTTTFLPVALLSYWWFFKRNGRV